MIVDMKANSAIDASLHSPQGSEKLEAAQSDFSKLMKEIEPFIKRSEIVRKSTEGSWFDTTSVLEKEVLQQSIYR